MMLEREAVRVVATKRAKEEWMGEWHKGAQDALAPYGIMRSRRKRKGRLLICANWRSESSRCRRRFKCPVS